MPPAPYQPRRRRCIARRFNRLFAVLDVPKDVRPKLGKTRFVQSLGTSDMATAERVAGPLLSAWRRAIVEARGQAPVDDAAIYRRALRNATTETARAAIMEQIEDGSMQTCGVDYATAAVASSLFSGRKPG